MEVVVEAGSAETDEPPITVWVDDVHPIFRRGLIASLTADGMVVAGATAAFHRAPELIEAPVNVFGATKETLAAVGSIGPDAKLVAIVPDSRSPLLGVAIQRGADAVLSRTEITPAALTGAVRATLTGTTTLPGGVLGDLLDRASNGGHHASGGLTERELAVLRLLAEGDDTREIAGALAYSERTVKNVVHDLMMKLNCRNRAHAVALATRQGVI
jgi:DNA-binding NarL/FixJ family response regulator